MRILMVAPEAFFSPRGTPLSVYHRAADLEALGHDVDVLTYPVGLPPPALRARVYRSPRIPFVTSVAPGPSLRKLALDALLAGSLVRRLSSGRYDIVYAHEESAFLAALIGPRLGIPYIYEMHSSMPAQFETWGIGNNAVTRAVFRRIERIAIKRAAAVVATCPLLASIARAIRPEVPVTTILNQYAASATAPGSERERVRAALEIGGHDRLVMYTGSFVPVQSLDMLVRAIPDVVRRAPQARFALVGGHAGESVPLQRLASTLGVRDFVRFIPAQPFGEMPAYLAAADVLVSPRVRGVNAPGKLMSYLQSGRPVVATDCPVHNQLLDVDRAFLTPPTAAGLAEGIVRAIENPGLAATVATCAGEFARAVCAPEVRAASYRALLAASLLQL